jgi:hypothetical protein
LASNSFSPHPCFLLSAQSTSQPSSIPPCSPLVSAQSSTPWPSSLSQSRGPASPSAQSRLASPLSSCVSLASGAASSSPPLGHTRARGQGPTAPAAHPRRTRASSRGPARRDGRPLAYLATVAASPMGFCPLTTTPKPPPSKNPRPPPAVDFPRSLPLRRQGVVQELRTVVRKLQVPRLCVAESSPGRRRRSRCSPPPTFLDCASSSSSRKSLRNPPECVCVVLR